MPVLVYLKDIDECLKFEKKLTRVAYVFDTEDPEKLDENLSILDRIKKRDDSVPQVIFTTKAASFGINFYPECYPIMTEKPDSLEQYLQIVGRSNRVDYKANKRAAMVNIKGLTQTALE